MRNKLLKMYVVISWTACIFGIVLFAIMASGKAHAQGLGCNFDCVAFGQGYVDRKDEQRQHDEQMQLMREQNEIMRRTQRDQQFQNQWNTAPNFTYGRGYY